MAHSGMSLRGKLTAMTIGTILALIALFSVLLISSKSQMMEDRQAKVRNLVEVAHAIVAHYEKESSAGKMSVEDAKRILSGGDDSATQYFKEKTSAQLAESFLPTVKATTDKLALADKYNKIASKAGSLGLGGDELKIESYVTRKALDGLFLMIAEEERAIRQNPLGAAGSLAKKAFGALGQ